VTILDRLLGRQPARTKATYGGPWLSAYSQGPGALSSLSSDPKDRMAKYLAAYKVGWFYKAGSKVSRDVAGLDVSLSYEDAEGDNEADIVAPANNVPFDSLSPTEQLLRLMERPNPGQTGRQLRAKTQIRLDFAGCAFWYLENGDGGRLPTAIYGISPTRMDPSLDKAGNLIGWVMDRSGTNPGIPFTTDEIVLFSTTTSTDEWWGVSVVEAVWSQVPLTDLIARHTADVLTMGGRLAGMMWPKERALDEAEYQDAMRAWRNVASDPNAARRLLLFPEPMEYATGAATPKDIGIPELSNLTREEITSAFGVNPQLLGVMAPAGLNSGETMRHIARQYWGDAVHSRAELIEETLQVTLVPRYEEAEGRPLDLDFEQPQLDNAAEVIEKAGALKSLVELGFDPKDAIRNIGLDHIAWIGIPEPPEPVEEEPAEPGQPEPEPVVKAIKARRVEVVGEVLPGFVPAMSEFLAEQRERLVANVEREYAGLTKAQRMKAEPAGWWDQALEDQLLGEQLDRLYVQLSRSALTVVSNEVNRVVTKDRIRRVTAKMLESAGARITDINEATREAARLTLSIGVQRGYTLGQLIGGVPAEGYNGIRSLVNPETGKAMFDAYRAELVARTETMRAYNESALYGYAEYDVKTVIASDGDYDNECRERDGTPFSVEDALEIADHPNGTLDWVPVVPDRKAVDVDRYAELAEAIKALADRRPEPSPAPMFILGSEQAVQALQPADVHVDAPDLGPVVAEIKTLGDRIEAMERSVPFVKVDAPIVNVDNVRVTSMPDRVHRIDRDKAGKPTGSVETDA
jgi:hypothetical protein